MDKKLLTPLITCSKESIQKFWESMVSIVHAWGIRCKTQTQNKMLLRLLKKHTTTCSHLHIIISLIECILWLRRFHTHPLAYHHLVHVTCNLQELKQYTINIHPRKYWRRPCPDWYALLDKYYHEWLYTCVHIWCALIDKR